MDSSSRVKISLKDGSKILWPDGILEIEGAVHGNHHGKCQDPDYYTWTAKAHHFGEPEKKVYLKMTAKDGLMYQSLVHESKFQIRFPFIEYIERDFEKDFEVNDEEKEFLVVVAEFIDGDTLKNVIDKKKIYAKYQYSEGEERELFRYILQLLYAVDAYSSRLVGTDCMTHRDLKPKNLMVSRKTGHLVVIDFDWSHIPGNDSYVQRNQDGIAICGTKGYSDPLNWMEGQGKVVHSDLKLDIYSIAMLIFFIMTGTDYFSAENEQDDYLLPENEELAYRFNIEKIPAGHPFRKDTYKPIHEIIRKAMAPFPERYSSVRDMIHDFESFLKNYSQDPGWYHRMVSFRELLDYPVYRKQNKVNKLLCRYYDIEKKGWRDIRLENHQSSILLQGKSPVLSLYNRDGELVCYPFHCEICGKTEEDGTIVLREDGSVEFKTKADRFKLICIHL